MSNLPIINTINANIVALNATKAEIKEAINTDYDIVTNQQIEAYPGLIQQQIDTYKARIPHSSVEGSSITKANTIPLKMDNLKIKGNGYNIIPQPSNTNIHYEELEYIESTGTQYINTGATANGLITNFDIKFMPTDVTVGTQYVFSAKKARFEDRFDIGWGNDKGLWIAYNTGEVVKPTIEVNTAYRIQKTGADIYLNENKIATISELTDFTTPVNIVAFANNINGTINYQGRLRLYYFKIYNDSTLIRNFIPCRKYDYANETEEVGLFDLVSETFFSNAGTEDFVAGDEVWHSVTGDCSVEVNGTNYPLTLGDLKIEDNGFGLYNTNYIFKNNGNWYLHEVSYISKIDGRVAPGQVYPHDTIITDTTLIAQLEALDKAKANNGATTIATSGEDFKPIYNAIIYTKEVSQ